MKHEKLSRRRLAGCLLGAGAASLPSLAAAQSTAPAAEAEAPVEIETIVVTGSRIRRTDAETASPVQVLTREDIDRSGKQNIADVLRSVSADNQGSLASAFSAGFASGASGVSLRGLGLNSTLVLVNGRRMAAYGLADDGQRSFVDLNSIPLEAVERVEVLKDGGSAIYGSDAVGGVVNIILRSNYQGAEMGGNFGTSYMDDGDYKRFHGSFGTGDERYNLFATIEGSTTQAIGNADREGYLGTNDLRRYGWYDNRRGGRPAGGGAFTYVDANGEIAHSPVLLSATPWGTMRPRINGATDPDPSHRINLKACPEISGDTGVCLFDPVAYSQIQPEQDRINLFSRGSLFLNSETQAYSELGWFFAKTQSTGTPGDVIDNGVYNAADPGNLKVHTTIMPANHPDNPYGVARGFRLLTTDFGGRNGEQTSNVIRAITGVQGKLSDWDWDVGLGYIRSELDDEHTGYIVADRLQAHLDDGSYRIMDPSVDRSVIDDISPTLKRKAKSSIALVDAKLSGSLFELPGGDFGVAFGTEARNEKTDTPPLPFTETGDIIGLGYSSFKADRDVVAGYVEANAPVLSFVELNAALRYDHYSDYGHSTTPKVGIKIKPLDTLALRATYSEAFRAPGPSESGNSSTYGFTGIGLLTIGNPDIKPERAKSYGAGIVFEPMRGTSATFDYYRIERRDEIVGADQALIIGEAPQSGQAPNSQRPGALPNSVIYYNEDGDLSAISAPYVNANKTTTSGFDFEYRQKRDFGQFGRISGGFMLTHVISFERSFDNGESYEYAGTHGPYVLSSAGGTPKDRARLELTWERAQVSVTGSVNYVGSMKMIDHKGSQLIDNEDGTWSSDTYEGAYYNVDPDGKVCGVYRPDGSAYSGCSLSSFTTVDLYSKVGVDEHWEFTASALNLFNRLAPFDPYTYGGLNYNPSFHQSGAVGRFVTLGLRYTF